MLTGKVDSSGIVTIAWKNNTEPDLLGYKVFRANTPDEDFISLGEGIISKNIFLDSINLNTLAQKIYYQVVAIDKRYNSSEYSSVLELSRPDTIRPAPALITRIDVIGGTVKIQFEGSPSGDIKSYELYRSSEHDTIPGFLIRYESNLPDHFDDELNDPGNYSYLLKTFDFAGNSSIYGRSVYVQETTQKSVNLRVEQSKNGRSIMLSWKIPEDFHPSKAIIYRGKDTEPVSIYITLEGAVQMFVDNNIEINTSYNYRIKIFSSKGNVVVSSGEITFTPLLNSISAAK
jgi:hypothetical protein